MSTLMVTPIDCTINENFESTHIEILSSPSLSCVASSGDSTIFDSEEELLDAVGAHEDLIDDDDIDPSEVIDEFDEILSDNKDNLDVEQLNNGDATDDAAENGSDDDNEEDDDDDDDDDDDNGENLYTRNGYNNDEHEDINHKQHHNEVENEDGDGDIDDDSRWWRVNGVCLDGDDGTHNVFRDAVMELPQFEEIEEDHGLVPSPISEFTWLGSVESWIDSHESLCSVYVPGKTVSACCTALEAEVDLELDIERHEVSQQLTVLIRRKETSLSLGRLPDSYAAVLLPLICSGIVYVTGRVGNRLHIENALPPFLLCILIDFKRISTHQLLQEELLALRKLRAWLKRPKGHFITPELPENISVLRRKLNDIIKSLMQSSPDTSVCVNDDSIKSEEKCDDDSVFNDDNVNSSATHKTTDELFGNKRRRIEGELELNSDAQIHSPSDEMCVNHDEKQSTPLPSVTEILQSRRRARAKQSIELCNEHGIELALFAIEAAAIPEYKLIFARYDFEQLRHRSRLSNYVIHHLLWKRATTTHQLVKERIDQIQDDYYACNDPLSAIGRLIGCCRAVRDRAAQLAAMHSQALQCFVAKDFGICSTLVSVWKRLLSANSEPLLSSTLCDALLHQIRTLNIGRVDLDELRALVATRA